MILKEKDLEKFRKKVVLDSFFGYKTNSENIGLGFNVYYDCGNGKGIISAREDKDTYEFAEDIKNNVSNINEDLFYVDADDEYIMASKGKLGGMNIDKNRQLYLKQLYAFGLDVDVPVFMQLEDDYFYINELKFEQKEEKEPADNTLEELDQFVQSHMYGDEYRKFKEEEKFYNMLSGNYKKM